MFNLYNSSNIDTLPWPDTYDGRYAKEFLHPLIKEGVHHYIDNIHTDLQVLVMGDLVLPITINEAEYENSYVCSPYTQYVTYAIAELYVIKNSFIQTVITSILKGLGKLLKRGKINRVVIVNNWLVSTNLYPRIEQHEIEAITAFLVERFPHHLIMWRSLNPVFHKSIIIGMKDLGYYDIAGRMVYLFDAKDKGSFKKQNLKHDQRMLKKGDYEMVNVENPEDTGKVADLYRQLYLEKYFDLNPNYTLRFFELAIRKKLLHIKALKKEGCFYGVLGYFIRNGVMTTPCFGYDLKAEQKEGLYRRLSTILINVAQQLELQLHCSSGAGQFKRTRGATPHIEYNLLYANHLTKSRRLIIWFFHKLIQNIGLPILKKFG